MMSDMPVTEKMKERLNREFQEVLAVGRLIGFGNLMSLASRAWQAELEENGSVMADAAFVVGPCKASVVPCDCDKSKDCDWCCGTGWLTKKVKEVKDSLP